MRSTRRGRAVPILTIVAAVGLSACGPGGSLASAALSSAGSSAAASPVAGSAIPAATTGSPLAVPSVVASQGGSIVPSTGLRLTSSAFGEGTSIPARYTCDGPDVSPPLAWDGVPAGAGGLVLIVDDGDAGGFIHWVVFDLPVAPTGALAEGASTATGAPHQGRNGFGRVGWGGPCPPSGTHHYRFSLVAISRPLGLSGTPSADAVSQALQGQILGATTLTGVYKRG